MRGGSNPMEIYRSSNSEFDINRIKEFNNYLDVLKDKNNNLKEFVQQAN